MNFDRASKENPGPSGAGFVARDSQGNIMAIGAKRLVDGSNNEAEVQAAWEAIRMAKTLKVNHLNLEGDSLLVVTTIAEGETTTWSLNKHIKLIISALSSFEDYKITHVKRSGGHAVKYSNVIIES
ncbi:uncharacterized protein LOC131032242 [Cryptomeria japonica]|uniref:uncharacterized protein LOC131032242 n=1 Tax=Cryptomeria japonica TaxID=3369 RepID=UPI0025AD0930|nr:uncharacterized protein LOC131032242 [Cryptomeria japonica]